MQSRMERIWKRVTTLCWLLHIVVAQIDTFSNPILDIAERDASLIRIDNFYYLAYADYSAKEIRILKSPFLTDFRNAEKGVIYKIPPGYTSYPPSSFFQYRNDLYLHFHMRNNSNPHYRMFCVKAQNPKNPLFGWSVPTRLLDNKVWNESAEHGAVLNTNGQLYYVWNGPSPTNPNYSLHIAKMKSPTEVIAPVMQIREPQEDWECYGSCSVHAPSFLYKGSKIYMTFTASSTFEPETSISYTSIENLLNPMNKSNWESAPGPVFQGNTEENVYSTRFAQFTSSPDGTETWMLYTASSDSANMNPTSRIRIEKIDWDETDGLPKFPVARANGYQQKLPSGEPSKFLNPILDEVILDPTVFFLDNAFYMVFRSSNSIVFLKSAKLFDFRNAETAIVYTAPSGFQLCLSARLEELDGEIYLYFCMQPTNGNRQMYVSKAENRSDIMQNWGTPTRLLAGVFEEHSFHGTVLQHFGQQYFVWAHLTSDSVNQIYIAPMQSPTEVVGPVVLLKEPSQTWECHLRCINDFPSFVYQNNVAIMTFSASAMTEPDVSVSYMSIEAGKDPLDVTNWYTASEPAFTRNDEENVFAPSRASFVYIPDTTETWMLYLGSNTTTDVVNNLKIRLEKIIWDAETGYPIFPKAHGFTNPQPIPG